jgi:4-alpha-glucanotransferase
VKVQFSVKYHTNWGETVRVKLTLFYKGGKHTELCRLETADGESWKGEASITKKEVLSFEYQYVICKDDVTVREEWNFAPRVCTVDKARTVTFHDAWRDVPADVHFYSSAFTRCIHPYTPDKTYIPVFDHTLILKTSAPGLKREEQLAVLGNQPGLGNWQSNQYLPMVNTQPCEWQLSLNADGLRFPLEYKFVVINKDTHELVEWEQGDNRVIFDPDMTERETVVYDEAPVRLSERKWKGAGTVIPVFSLRSAESWGIGDFRDMKKMVDWLVHTHQHILQVLPVNDTILNHNWMDSYPYNAISVYALQPMYINPTAMGYLREASVMQNFLKRANELNALPQIDFEAVMALKFEYFERYYEEQWNNISADRGFLDFVEECGAWLRPYAAFCYLKDKYHTGNFEHWEEFSEFDAAQISAFFRPEHPYYKEVLYYCYLQYVAHLQLSDATGYARRHGVVVKGDIPIGVCHDSADAWAEPYYFNRDKQTGAPPDDFSVNGQNWGFPTYNWECILQDDGAWWKRRFHQMARYFDAYRIDHVLGFFRIWEIPEHSVHGLLGQFVPALPLTVEEIEAYGLPFQKERFTQPYITDAILQHLFGEHADYVKRSFLTFKGSGTYALRRAFDTQRKVQVYFHDKEDADSVRLRDGLYSLISNVLFVEDREDVNLYHPRIVAQNDFLYKSLTPREQEAFNRLYEDYFYHRHSRFWYDQAMRKLPMLVACSGMLACAEDLGMVPECVPWVMDDLRILTLEIQRMPKAFGVEFAHTENYPYRSVCTISTHDMSTLRGWWEEDYAKTNRFYREVLQKDGDAPRTAPGWICEEVVARHLFSPSMLTLISWQDWMSMDEAHRFPDVDAERINVPANPRHYWRYRMHISLEELMSLTSLNEKIKELISNSGR